MNYIVIVLLSIVYTFGICFIVQIRKNKSSVLADNVKCCLPKPGENRILFVIVLFMLILCGVFLQIMYNTALIDCVRLLTILALLCPAAYTDWNEHIIANKLILFALCLRVVLFGIELLVNFQSSLFFGLNSLITAAVVFVIGFLCSLIFKGSIGMGDIKLIVVMALFQGASGVTCSVFVSLVVSFVYCIAVLIMKRKSKHDIIPFAPSLLMGTFISICLFGI